MKSTTIIPLSFSAFVIQDAAGGSVDPLGLQATFFKLTNLLFPQFTTLTNYPRYHQILCALLLYLQNRVKQPKFNRIFREFENLWGIAQTLYASENENAVAPLNVTKYQPILDESDTSGFISFEKTNHNNTGLFDRLGYGTLGFYTIPSRTWGLVAENRIVTTPIGEKLGQIVLNQFVELLDRWKENKMISLKDKLLKEFSEKIAINPVFSEVPNEEKSIWKCLLSRFIENHSPSVFYEHLWTNLPSAEKIDSITLEDKYKSFFPALEKEYETNKGICSLLRYCNMFEQFSSSFEFLFELEYFLVQEKDYLENNDQTEAKQQIFEYVLAAVPFLLKERSYLRKNLGSVLENLGKCKTWDKAFPVMVQRHTEVQKKKGKRPYFDENRSLLQFNQVPFDRVKSALDGFHKNGHDAVRFIYRRDWHFRRAALYKEFMS